MASLFKICYTFWMPSSQLHTLHRALRFATATLALASIAVAAAVVHEDGGVSAYVLRGERKPVPWRVFDQNEVQAGVSIPQDTHVVFHLPETFTEITLNILFGQTSSSTRFWGYCLPPNYDASVQTSRSNLPGQLFLSEAERSVRNYTKTPSEPRFSLFSLPSKEDLREGSTLRGRIRHELEMFKPGMLCYVQTEAPLPLGIDSDGDSLNTRLEKDLGTRPDTPDSDGDGILDGIEYRSGTNPIQRDSDVDGLIDGIEDKNWNGRIDVGETDPRNKDSDRDELCDGLCLVKLSNNQKVYIGEDKNLDGATSDKETDPLKWDTDGNGSSDFQEYINCEMKGKKGC